MWSVDQYPPWSKLYMANWVYSWSLGSIASSTMHIWGMKLNVILHWRSSQGCLHRQSGCNLLALPRWWLHVVISCVVCYQDLTSNTGSFVGHCSSHHWCGQFEGIFSQWVFFHKTTVYDVVRILAGLSCTTHSTSHDSHGGGLGVRFVQAMFYLSVSNFCFVVCMCQMVNLHRHWQYWNQCQFWLV